jgi:hypothetical protein
MEAGEMEARRGVTRFSLQSQSGSVSAVSIAS